MTPALEGVAAAAITPRRGDDGSLDLGAALEVIDYLAGSGVEAICLLGTTGEFLHFGLEERARLTNFAVKRTTLPVFANVSHSTLEGAVELARQAVSGGAAALLLMPPYFFRYPQSDLAAFYLSFAEEFDGGPPLVLYNIPFFSNPLEAATVERLLAGGRFAAIKDSSGDWDNFLELQRLRERTAFRLLVGNDVLFTRGRSAGADGVVSGVACAVPELITALDRAIRSGNAAAVERLEGRLQEFLARIDPLPTPIGVREAVALRGLKTGPHAVPLGEENTRRLGEFREWFPGFLAAAKKDCEGV